MKIEVGERVRVENGPFKGYQGQVRNVGSDGLVQVSLELIKGGLTATFLSAELAPYDEDGKTHSS